MMMMMMMMIMIIIVMTMMMVMMKMTMLITLYYDGNADDDTADTQLTTLLYLCMNAAINFDTICTTICRGHS